MSLECGLGTGRKHKLELQLPQQTRRLPDSIDKRHLERPLAQPLEDEDDDGETAMQETRKSTYVVIEEKITKEQLQEIEYELEGWATLAADILKKLNLVSFADLKKSMFLPTTKRTNSLFLPFAFALILSNRRLKAFLAN